VEPDLDQVDLDSIIVLSRHASLKTRGDRDILVLPERAIQLQGSSAEILRLCQAPRSGHQILAKMLSRYPDEPQIDEQVAAFLADMITRGALEVDSSAVSRQTPATSPAKSPAYSRGIRQ
jgi:hypothetical protein